MERNVSYNESLYRLCPVYNKFDDLMVEKTGFWIDGVASSSVAIVGLVANTVAAYVLARPSMRNSFNLLLVALTVIDNAYLFFTILENFRKRSRKNIYYFLYM